MPDKRVVPEQIHPRIAVLTRGFDPTLSVGQLDPRYSAAPHTYSRVPGQRNEHQRRQRPRRLSLPTTPSWDPLSSIRST
jgi:hypothetical protein